MIQVKLERINTIYVFSDVCIFIYTLIISEYDLNTYMNITYTLIYF